MSPMLRSATAAVGRAVQSRRILLHRRRFSNGTGQEVDMLSKKIKVTTMNLAKRDLVKENVESLIIEQQMQFGVNNIGNAWIVGGIALVGYLFGNLVGVAYAKYESQSIVTKE